MTRSPVDQVEPDLSFVRMKVTYYLDVFSSWCTWVEPTWAELKMRYAGVAEFEWKIALMRAEDFPVSREEAEDMIMQARLKAGWVTEADLAPPAEEAIEEGAPA